MHAGFGGIFIPGFLNRQLPVNPCCKPLPREISVQNIPHGPVYPAAFAGYITLGNMELVEKIKSAWGWTGIEPLQVIGENDFGNLIVCDQQGQYWRICPEDLYCKLIARDRATLNTLIEDEDFQEDWNMRSVIEEARSKLVSLTSGRKYCLKIPGPLGGEYGGTNLASISLLELITVSGDIALQIRDLPDGAQVRFQITN